MPDRIPAVYLLIGEDEFAIAETIAALQAKMGDPAMAEVNTTRLDGRVNTLDELEAAAGAMPFLTARRLVIFTHPLERARTPDGQKRLKDILLRSPATTALVLVEERFLTSERDRRNGKIHWLESWAQEQHERVYLCIFSLPEGAALVKWIQKRAEQMDGKITPQAADWLAAQVGAEPRSLEQEIAKLLAYVNYSRPIEVDDVRRLTPDTARVGDFALINALREGKTRQSLSLLHKELEEKDEKMILGSIVSQFRQLILAREALDQGISRDDFIKLLAKAPFKVSKYPAGLAADQARRFRMEQLEKTYHRLLELDEALKTGEMSGPLALDLLVTELTLGS